MNQPDLPVFLSECRHHFEESGVLGGAGFFQPSGNSIEALIVVAGMANQLPCPFRHAVEKLCQSGGVERTGGQHTDGSVGGGKTGLPDVLHKLRAQAAQEPDLKFPGPWRMGGCGGGPFGLEGIADGVNSAMPRGAQERTQHGREHVGVLVRVQMGEVHPGGLQAVNLGSGFEFDLGLGNGSAQQVGDEGPQRWPKASRSRRKAGNFMRRERGSAIHQDDMAAHPERAAVGKRLGCSGGEMRGGRHEGRGGQGACVMQFHDGLIDAGGQAEIVSVENELGHVNPSLNNLRADRNFGLLTGLRVIPQDIIFEVIRSHFGHFR
jgi:hypothetical protein